MADWHGIRAALATKLGAVSGVESASADSIDNAPSTPAVLITNVSTLDMTDRGAGYEYREADINGLLLVARTADTGTAMDTAEDLAEAITVAMRTGVQLGYTGIVQDSYVRLIQLGGVTVGGIDYVGATMVFRVVVRENVTRTA